MSKMKLPGEIANTRPDKCASQMKILLCKFSLRRFAKIVLRVLALVFLLMVTAIAILYINSTWPYNWNLPKGMPLVLGFTTDMGVEDMVELLSSEYLIGNNAIKVDVIDYQHVFLKKEALRHRLVVENFSVFGIAPKQLECRFLKNRLMTVIFRPALSEEECKALLGDDYDRYQTSWDLVCEAGAEGSTHGDQLMLIDWCWGTGIHSKLLWKAYVDWLGFR